MRHVLLFPRHVSRIVSVWFCYLKSSCFTKALSTLHPAGIGSISDFILTKLHWLPWNRNALDFLLTSSAYESESISIARRIVQRQQRSMRHCLWGIGATVTIRSSAASSTLVCLLHWEMLSRERDMISIFSSIYAQRWESTPDNILLDVPSFLVPIDQYIFPCPLCPGASSLMDVLLPHIGAHNLKP